MRIPRPMAQTLTMSDKERQRLKVLERVKALELTDTEAATMLDMSLRQYYRIKKAFAADGDEALVHKLRGRSSNRGYELSVKQQIIELYRERYSDYGPTLFAEMLQEHHQITLAAESLRQWLLAAGLWQKQIKRRRHRRKRPRRGAIGELVQFDGSIHDWFEGRGPSCTAIVIVDDASSRVFIRFVTSENTEDCMRTMMLYIERYGIPQAIYIDGGSVYFSDSGTATDFALAMKELGIEMIRARSPQAKGRVERSNRTHQDRLIKALRRAGVSSIDEANALLEASYLDEHNGRFAQLDDLSDVHRSAAGVDLERIFCWRTQRVVSNDWSVRLNSAYLQIVPSSAPMPPSGTRVELRRFLDGSLHVYWGRDELVVTPFEQKPAPRARPQPIPKAEHPWKRQSTLGDKRRGLTARERARQRRRPSDPT
jgi:transposase